MKFPTYIERDWPALDKWPSSLGTLPTATDVQNAAAVCSRRGTAVQMALAMYFRNCGATDDEAAQAAKLATGRVSKTHKNKRNGLIDEGVVRRINLAKRNGKGVVRIVSAKGDCEQRGKTLTHLNERGEAHMVDVSEKAVTERTAAAEGFVSMQPETLKLIEKGDAKKGDVLATARIAGIMAAKRTHELIPLCHPLALSQVSVEFEPSEDPCGIAVRSTVKVSDKTGVEMEALTAVSVACLTIYDMVKAVDRAMSFSGIRLVEKTGGRSGHFKADT